MIRLTRPPCPNPTALQTNYKHPENKDALLAAASGKCMYCESKVSHTYFGDIEHIRPKDRFVDLEFDWNNLGFVCAKCNNSKLNKWHESNPYINPYEENPGTYLAPVGPFVFHRGGSERGEVTIRDISLNRTQLVERRQVRINAIHALIDKVNRTVDLELKAALSAELDREVDKDSEYSFVTKEALEALR